MTRNMVRRVEVGVPVLSKNLRTRIKKIFEIEMNDTEKGRVLDSHGIYEKRNKEIGGKKKSVKLLNSQEFFFDQAYKVARSVK